MGLELENISVNYGEKKVLDNISLQINYRDKLAILGSNGVGKTTLLKAILSLLKIKGACYLDGVNLKKYSLRDRAKKIAYVPQYLDINFSISVIEYIYMGRAAYKNEDKGLLMKKAEEVIKKFELENIALKNMNQLSGGEKQKVMIAKAIIQETKVIVLDEPTNNLDIKYQKKVLEILDSIVKEKNIIVIMTIHDLPLANKYCNKFLFLKDKKIYAYGNSKEVLTEEKIKEIYETEVEIIEHKGERKILVV
ncbi:hypothetical protein CSA08_04975 [Candidatus Gracilibacteria bacterium]|nr:MAG: hypothetical protein CSA08_04975 [Candidatus Gracilibacteria bacterium]